MNKENYLSKEDLSNLLKGISLFSTGGGGLIENAKKILESETLKKNKVKIIDLKKLKPNTNGITVGILGGGVSKSTLKKLKINFDKHISYDAYLELKKHIGEVSFVYSVEIGIQNTLEAILLASCLDVPIVDGDCAGRAVPEMQLTTLTINKISYSSFLIKSFLNDINVFVNSKDNHKSEILARSIANISQNLVCLVGIPLTSQEAKKILIPNTLSECIQVGKMLNNDDCLLINVAKKVNGEIKFKGKVSKITFDNKNSFFSGYVHINGIDKYEGDCYKIWFKNEFLISWKNNIPDILCPDLISLINPHTRQCKISYGQGFKNEIKENETLVVFKIPSKSIWQSKEGLNLFSPRTFGFNIKN